MDKKQYPEFMRGLNSAMGQFGGNWYGTSLLDQYRNADAGLNYLRGNLNRSDEHFNGLESGLKSQKGQAVMTGVAMGLNELANAASSAMSSAQIDDTSNYYDRINDLSNVGLYGYSSYDQLQRDYNDTDFGFNVSKKDIRGMTGMEKAGAIGSSALSGAMTGMQIGGPWGALAGAVIGGGISAGGVLAGDSKSRIERDFLNNQGDLAANISKTNMDVAGEYLGERGARWREAHRVAQGGRIHRQSLQEFADKVLGNKGEPQVRLIKTYCKGGVKFSIKK